MCVWIEPAFLRQSWQIEDGGRTGWLVAMQNACSIFLINEAWTEPSLHFSLQVSAQPVTGCAASRFFTAVFVKRDKRRHAAPSPACFEVWKGRGSSSQFLFLFFFLLFSVSEMHRRWGILEKRSGGVTGNTWRFSAGCKLQRFRTRWRWEMEAICPISIKNRRVLLCSLWKFTLLGVTNNQISLRAFF